MVFYFSPWPSQRLVCKRIEKVDSLFSTCFDAIHASNRKMLGQGKICGAALQVGVSHLECITSRRLLVSNECMLSRWTGLLTLILSSESARHFFRSIYLNQTP
jgi:hypothetical protein